MIRSPQDSSFVLGALSGSLNASVGPAAAVLLGDLDFRTPVEQAFGSVSATHQYLLQEESGDYSDTGTGTTADIDTFTAGLQGQARPGIWNGASLVAIKAWETDVATARAAVSDTSVFDSNNSDLYFRIEFAIFGAPAAAAVLTEKRNGVAAGWTVEVQTDGTIDVIIEDESANTIRVQLVGNHCTGAPGYLEFFYDDSEDELTVNSNLDLGNAATDTAAVTGTLTNGVAWRLGDPDSGITAALFQVFLAEGAEGAAAATMFAETGWWTHATDPTPKKLLTTKTRASLISFDVAPGFVGHWSSNQIASAYSAALAAGAGGLGLLHNSAVTNLVPNSRTSGSATGATTNTDNAVDAADGFRAAATHLATASPDFVGKTCVTDAEAPYIGSAYRKEVTAAVAGRIYAYDLTNGAEIAGSSAAFTADAIWTRIKTLAFTTPALCVSVSLRVEITSTGETIALDFWQLEAGTAVTHIVNTSGAAAALAASDYRAGSTGFPINLPVGEVKATFARLKYVASTYVYNISGTGTVNRKRVFSSGLTDYNTVTKNGGDTTEVSITAAHGSTFAESVQRNVWDQSATGIATGGLEAVAVFNGVTEDGDASPWEDLTPGAPLTTISIGTTLGSLPIDAIIARIESYDGVNGAIP